MYQNQIISGLHELATRGPQGCRITLAQDKRTPESVLDVLAADADETVRAWTADNPRTPQDTLRQLAWDC